jgi:hypothetical protein
MRMELRVMPRMRIAVRMERKTCFIRAVWAAAKG